MNELAHAAEEAAALATATAAALSKPFDVAAARVGACLTNGGKVLACGNGGSAAAAQHLTAELIGRFRAERRALPAITLGSEIPLLSAVANDYGYSQVFARHLEAIAEDSDVLLAFSTSGESPNIVAAARTAARRGLSVVAFSGNGGSELASIAEVALAVPSSDPARIQEAHLLLVHSLVSAVETSLT